MKKLTVIFSVLIALAIGSHAQDIQRNTGAGLGYMIFEGQDGLLSQVLAVTTNGTFGNQTFAITSGTLGASQPDSIVQNQKLENFVAENMDNLAHDIAVGSGESLDTLVELMQVEEASRPAVRQTLKQNFATIYASDEVTHQDVINSVNQIVKG